MPPFLLYPRLSRPVSPLLPGTMTKSQLSLTQKSRALALLEQGMCVIRVAAELQVARMTIYRLKKAGGALPPGTTPRRKEGSGRPRKTSPRTDQILKREVMSNPSITALEIKEKHPEPSFRREVVPGAVPHLLS